MNDWQHSEFLLRARLLDHLSDLKYGYLFSSSASSVFLLRHATIRILNNELYNE